MNMKNKFYLDYKFSDLIEENILKDKNGKSQIISFTSRYNKEKEH